VNHLKESENFAQQQRSVESLGWKTCQTFQNHKFIILIERIYNFSLSIC